MPHVRLPSGPRLHYLERGEGRPLVFVPGHVSALSWGHQLLEFGGGYRCIAVDQRGHGDSEKPGSGYTYPDFADDLRAFLEAIDLTDAVVVGHSMAACVAVQYALDTEPPRRATALALVGAGLPRLTHGAGHAYGFPPATAEQVLKQIATGFPEVLTAVWQNLLHRPDMEATRNWLIAEALRMPAHAVFETFREEISADFSERLGQLDLSVRFFHGRHDAICDPRWAEVAAALLPGARLIWFDESGHCPHLEEPERFNEELRAFIDHMP